MKAIGVVRRIDDLGRIVIPKELRKTMRIKEGDSLEIFIDGTDKVVLRKYSPVQNINEIVNEFVIGLYEATKSDIIITDNEQILAVAGSVPKELVGRKLSLFYSERIKNRSTQIIDKPNNFEITEQYKINKPLIFKTISVYGDILGSVLIVCSNQITDIEKSLVDFSTSFFNKYLEN